MKRLLLAICAALLWPLAAALPAQAQTVNAITVASCGSLPNTPVVGNSYPIYMDTTGKLCVNATVSASATIAPFTATGGAVKLTSGSSASANIALTAAGPNELIYNSSSTIPAWVTFGASNAVAAAVGTTYYVPPSQSIAVTGGGATWVAAFGVGGTADIYVTPGTGSASGWGGGTGGSGSATTTTAVSACARAISAGAGNPFVVNLFNALCVVNVDPATGAPLDPAAAQPAGTNHIGSFNLDPATTGGCTPAGQVTTASTNATSVKGSAGTFCGGHAVNTTATLAYIRWYNLAAAPTCSSATGYLFSTPVPANTAGSGLLLDFGTYGAAFSTGIAWCVTGGGTSTDNTNAVAGVYINYATK